MKILQVSNFLAPVHGGSAAVPYQLSKALVKNGHDVSIYTSNYHLDANSLPPTGIKIQAFSSCLQIASFDITPGMNNALRKNICNFDIVHLHNYRTYQNIAAHHYAKKYGIPYVVQAHGSLITYYQKSSLKKMYDAVWGRRMLKDAAKVLAVSPVEVAQYKSLGVSQNKIEVVPNGIDLNEYSNLPGKEVFRKKYNLGNDLVILYLGRIHKSKGLDLLVKAFAALTNKMDNIKLVIAGPDGGYLYTLKGLLRDLNITGKTVITGPLYEQEKLEAYTAADLFVNPRADEIFGLVFLEALACGTPVICSEGCGIADLINGRVGLMSADNENALSEAIEQLLKDTALRQKYSEAGKLLVRGYDWVKIAEQVEKVYKTALK
jgi:glycosyltransferase involved in cell wall biosynthesis